MELQTSLKYDKFKTINSNRDVDQKHVNNLKKKIQAKNLLHLNPIIVNSKFEVVDGQHRLEVARQLKLPIFYIVEDNIGEGDIADLNTTKKNWSIDEYINHFAKKKNKEYIQLKSFISKHPHLQKSLCYKELYTGTGSPTNAIRDGGYAFGNDKKLEELIVLASDFKEFKFRYSRDFILALKQCLVSGVYDHQKMLDKVEKNPGMLIYCSTMMGYVELLEKIFNRGTSLNIVSFKLSAVQRQKILSKEVAALNRQKKETKGMANERRITRAMLSPAELKKDQEGKSVKVVIDSKTTLFVKPGTDIKALKKKYADRELAGGGTDDL